MIDEIIDLKNKDLSETEYKAWEDKIISSQDPRLIFLFAYYAKNKSVEKLSQAILATNNVRYIRFFMRSIKKVDIDLFVNKILDIGNISDLYYTFFDNPYIDDKYIIKIIMKIQNIDPNSYYLYDAFYYYFMVLKKNNDDIFNLLKERLIINGLEVTKENYHDLLNTFRDKYNKQYLEEYTGELSHNCYKDHGGYIPDMIVLHISSKYGKTLKNFFDDELEVSAHYVINYDGEVKNIVSLEQSAWANGTSLHDASDIYYKFSSNDIINTRAYNANYYSYSIEHISYDGSLTEEQYQSSLKVIKNIIIYIKEKYNYDFIIDRKHLVGHNEVNPIVRTSCPGVNFPFDRLINDLKTWQNNKI